VNARSPLASAASVTCRQQLNRRQWVCTAALLTGLVVLEGCAAYRFGNRSLYPQDIQTVYVPVFESDSFRMNLAEFLTEAIAKEIETKRVVIEDPYDYPRETQINMSVEVRWVDRKGAAMGQPMTVAVPEELVTISNTGMLVPEYGQSVSTAQLQAIQRLATQIVSLMESPW
jgi:hypothetical protein